MDENQFWEIINKFDWQHEGDDEKVLLPALNSLIRLPVEEIFEFDEIMTKLLYNLDGKDIAKRTYKNRGDFSDDLFLYLRCVAIINGRDYYYKVLSGDVVLNPDLEFESLLYLPREAWAIKCNKDMGEYPYDTKYCFETGSNKKLWA